MQRGRRERDPEKETGKERDFKESAHMFMRVGKSKFIRLTSTLEIHARFLC